MMKLMCAACIASTGGGRVGDAITVYHGHALCQEHMKQALRRKERKIW